MTTPEMSPYVQAVHYAAQHARATYPEETARIDRALELALDGHVTLLGHGEAAVHSQTGPAVYHVNGACPCQDYPRAPAGRCKHRFAKALVTRANAILAQAYYATVTHADGRMLQGLALQNDEGWVFLPTHRPGGWCVPDVLLVLHGRYALRAAADAEETNLAAMVCGYACAR